MGSENSKDGRVRSGRTDSNDVFRDEGETEITSFGSYRQSHSENFAVRLV